MTKAIQQSVEFPATPKALFELYMDSTKHSESTGGRARISRKEGGKFSAWDGQLRGHNLYIVPGKLIVQAWRSSQWKPSDPDSILILRFRKTSKGHARVDLVHENVPVHDHQGVTKGWPTYYWKPWRRYLAAH
jgi:activator of HSP90 ATPase